MAKDRSSLLRRDATRSAWKLPRYTAAGLFVVSVLALLYVADRQWLRPGQLRVAEVEVSGAGNRVSVEQVLKQVEPWVKGGILHLNPEQISERVARLPWVKSASVKRIWPRQIEIMIEEYQPALRWDESTWIDRYGDVFSAGEQPDLVALPVVHGPQSQRETVIAHYLQLNGPAKALGLKIARLEVDARNAWTVEFPGGLTLELGRENFAGRWQRFITVWTRLNQDAMKADAEADANSAAGERLITDLTKTIESMDLRYPHGLAIRWRNNVALPAKG